MDRDYSNLNSSELDISKKGAEAPIYISFGFT